MQLERIPAGYNRVEWEGLQDAAYRAWFAACCAFNRFPSAKGRVPVTDMTDLWSSWQSYAKTKGLLNRFPSKEKLRDQLITDGRFSPTFTDKKRKQLGFLCIELKQLTY